MLQNIKIRSLNENDLNAVVRIDKKVLGKERRDFWKRKIAYSDIYPRPSLVAEVDGNVVGFILGYVSGWEFGVPNSVGWIDTLGVDPDYQRKGIGRLLFDALIEVFKNSGKEKMPEAKGEKKTKIEGVNIVYTLVSWDRMDLLQFYHAMGFKKGDVLNLEFKIR
jgi:ribosomal protein S18 acetylase RimI-like enzyme